LFILRWLLRLSLLGATAGVWLGAGVYLFLSPDLPDVETLRDVQLQTPMRVYTREGELIGEFGEQKRTPLRFDDIPQSFIEALLAAEDDAFFEHSGIDLAGLARAVSELLLTGEKGSGGSTLTMQVARNYFLSLERTFMRKFNEILLALEIERRLSKEEIFELYVNRVFLGHRAYGFEAASEVYYGTSLRELSVAQHAMLAGIPKAPSRNNPISEPEAALERRNWILGRMLKLGYLSDAEYGNSYAEADTARPHGAQVTLAAEYAAEMVRRQMLERYGLNDYNAGYRVFTTLRGELQQVAQAAVVEGLRTYDQRHGYRGAEQQLPPRSGEDAASLRQRWLDVLAQVPVVAGMVPAVVTEVAEQQASVLLANGSETTLAWDNGLRQANPYRSENFRGGPPQNAGEVLAVGDLVRLRRDADAGADADVDAEGVATPQWHLTQVPAAQAALVALDPVDGAIISLVGGIGFELSKFNRATQAERQPGSNFKPFLYAAALDAGYTPASIINDAPIVLEDASLEGIWRPENDGGRFDGPTRLRMALIRSRNLVSIRLLRQLGVERLIDYAASLGIDTTEFPRNLSIALGTHSMTPLELASAYAVLANGGYAVEPHLIARIEDADGTTIFRARPATVCPHCEAAPEPGDTRAAQALAGMAPGLDPLPAAPRVMDERIHFLLDSMLQDVIRRGTGRRALTLKREDLAGKTGTTNGPVDAWFSGYHPEVVATAWVGFDDYSRLGNREFGGTAALPIWIDYMRTALRGIPEHPRTPPAGIVSVRIDPDTGLLADINQDNAVFEFFREEHAPQQTAEEGALPGATGTDDLLQDIF